MELFRRQPTTPITDAELNARLHAAIAGAPGEVAGEHDRRQADPRRVPAASAAEPGDAGNTSTSKPGWGEQILEFGRAHVMAIGLAMACALGFTSYQLLRAGAEQVPIVASPIVASPSHVSPLPAPTAAPSSPASVIQVHVIGEVRQPGVVRLPTGARVGDAVGAAGGFTSKAIPGDLNLAAPVLDGSQVLVGGGVWPVSTVRAAAPVVAGSAPGSPGGTALVNLNTATAEQLEALPGVGPVTAQRILEWRQAHGRFSAISELQEVSGIGPKLYATLAPLVTV